MKLRKTILLLSVIAGISSANAQKWFTPEVVKEAEQTLRLMTLDEKLSFVAGNWMFTQDIARLGIKSIKMSDGPQGLGTHGQSTAYPCIATLAASWNEDLAYRYGASLASDCKARGVNMLLGPGVNIYRSPLCGRNFEYSGEDPFLASKIAVGYINGVQDNGVIATVKHYMGNNSEYDRHRISNDIDLRTLNEIYFPAFKAAVQEAGVGAVMSSYNLWNGVYVSESPFLTTEILRNQWGFKGFVVSDWGATHHCIPAVKSGLDLEMPSDAEMSPENLKYYLTTGDIKIDQIDAKVRHILRTQIGFNMLNGIDADKTIPLDDPKSASVALDAAREGIVLLKNIKNTLPINTKKVKRIIVTGENAVGYVKGGGSGAVNPFHSVSFLDGIKSIGAEYGIEVEYIDPYDLLPPIIFTDNSMKETGWNVEYYKNTELKGEPFKQTIEKKIDKNWPGFKEIEGLSDNDFSIRWTGTICSSTTADYEIALGGDDGFRIYIDDKAVINEWENGGFRMKRDTLKLEAGKKYNVKIEFYQGAGTGGVKFMYRNLSGSVYNPKYAKRFKNADMIIACVGFNNFTECEGGDRNFELSDVDQFVLATATDSKKPVIGVLSSGGGVDMQSWEPNLKGLIWAGYAGQEGGTALAEILFGKINPSGHLPMTFEKRWEDNPTFNSYHDADGDKHVAYSEGVFVGYRGYDKLKREVQYPFGYGLSYSTFSLSDITVAKPNQDGTVNVSVRLKNTGKHEGAEVVQVYVGKSGSSKVERPEKELRQFKKVSLKPNESKIIKMTLPKESFMYYDVNSMDFVADKGLYNVMIGFTSRDIKLTKTLNY